MKVSLFLGAGASAMFGKHTTSEFLQLLPKRLDAETGKFYKRLDDKLRFKDIEEALQALKDVRLFGKTDVSKVVFASTSMPGSQDAQSGFWPSCTELKNQIESVIKSHYAWNHDHDQKLQDAYDQIFRDLKSRTGAVTVFTTNYDTAIETYCRMAERTCVDGFAERYGRRAWTGDFGTQNAKNPVRLYKLHGSLEWKLHKTYGIIMSPELSGGPNIKKDIMIMPTRSPKDEEDENPFSEIFGLMKKEFKEQDACIAVGCSFRDESVNEVFREFIQDKKMLIVISPTVVEDLSDNLFKQKCKSASGDHGESYIFPKDGQGCVAGFDAEFESSNAPQLISESLDVIRERSGRDPCRDLKSRADEERRFF